MRHLKKHRLGELVEILSGFAFDSEKFGDSGEMPIVRIRDVIRGHSSTFYSGEFDKKYVLRDGDMLIGMDGEFNLAKWQGGPAVLNQRVCRISASSGILDDGYLFRFLPSALKAIENVTPYVTVKHLSVKTIRDIEIPLPPLAEQQRIAEVLDKAEALRAKRRAALAQVDSLTQSLFLDLFGDPATNPKDWPVSGIEDVCELIVDCVNRTAPIVDSPTPFKMIRTTNVKEGKVNLASVRYVTEEVFKRWNRRTTPMRGDVLLTREAPVGEAGMIESDDFVFLGQRLMLYRANRERMTPEYLLGSFRGEFLQHQFNRHGSGSTVKHLPLPACRSFQIPVPPIELQREFARRITAVEKLKTAQRAALAELDALFASLQHRAFRGEL